MYNIIIIGGGIGGMYCCEQLSKKYKTLLLDERNYLGGRIKTHYKPQFEEGAGRFHSSHKILLQIIKKCDLTKIKIGGPKNYISLDGEIIQNANEYFDKKMKQILNYADSLPKEQLQKYTLKEFLQQIISKKEIQELINIFGYTSEFYVMNAYDSLQAFKNTFIGGNFYVLKEGLRQIIKCLEQRSRENGAVIKTNSKVINIKKIENCFSLSTNTETYYTEKIIFATKAYNLLDFSILSPIYKKIKSVVSTPLLRIYAKYPKQNGEVWFNNMPTTSSDSILRQIIPLNYQTGLIMISYTDGIDVKPFLTKSGKLRSENVIKSLIKNELQKIFPNKNIPNPTYFHPYLWTQGCHYWKKNNDSSKISKFMINPIKNMYICGESFSTNQAWMEGALETATEVIKKINK